MQPLVTSAHPATRIENRKRDKYLFKVSGICPSLPDVLPRNP